MTKNGIIQGKIDPTLFNMLNGNDILFVQIYVDGMFSVLIVIQCVGGPLGSRTFRVPFGLGPQIFYIYYI